MDPVNNNPQQPTPVTPQPAIQTTPSVPSPQKKKGKLGMIISLLIILFLLCVSGAAGYTIYKNLNSNQGGETACTMEALICPDGTAVGRSGPNCEFSPCPTASPDPTADWKTYEGDGFSFMYPSDWSYVEENDGSTGLGPVSTQGLGIDEKVEPHVSPSVWFSKNESVPNYELIDYLQISDTIKESATKTQITVGGIIGLDVNHNGCQSGYCRDVIFQKAQIVYQFFEQNKLKELDQILSTFKFTE